MLPSWFGSAASVAAPDVALRLDLLPSDFLGDLLLLAPFPLIATRHPAAPWLRPPLRSLRVVEEFLDSLMSRGFNEDQAIAAYLSFTSFLLGHLLLESAARGASTAPVEEPLNEGEADLPNADVELSVTDYPIVARLKNKLSEDHTEAEFEQALEALLERMDFTLSQ